MIDELTYLAAHAPSKPQWKFAVIMPAGYEPKRPNPIWLDALGHRVSSASQSLHEDPANYETLAAWDREYDVQMMLQWRWVWAKAMLEAKTRLEDGR